MRHRESAERPRPIHPEPAIYQLSERGLLGGVDGATAIPSVYRSPTVSWIPPKMTSWCKCVFSFSSFPSFLSLFEISDVSSIRIPMRRSRIRSSARKMEERQAEGVGISFSFFFLLTSQPTRERECTDLPTDYGSLITVGYGSALRTTGYGIRDHARESIICFVIACFFSGSAPITIASDFPPPPCFNLCLIIIIPPLSLLSCRLISKICLRSHSIEREIFSL